MTFEMYKTVKQGENSLQYKILAQGEEGLNNVKCKKSRRGRTIGIITVIMLLVGGVIATAVLVPLVLTDDFITLTGTFQKFSVSTLRRSHSGNHIVVIAKKPHGWDPSHSNAGGQSSVKTTISTNHLSDKSQTMTTVKGPNITTTANPTTASEMQAKRTTPKVEKMTEVLSKIKSTVETTSTEGHGKKGNKEKVNDSLKSSTASYTLVNQKNPEVGVGLEDIPSTVKTPWYHNENWPFESPNAFLARSKKTLANAPLRIFAAVVVGAAVIITVIVLLMRNVFKKKKLIQKEATELKEDKTRLLRPSARTSDEE